MRGSIKRRKTFAQPPRWFGNVKNLRPTMCVLARSNALKNISEVVLKLPVSSRARAKKRRSRRENPPISNVSWLRAPRHSWVDLTNADRRLCSRAKTAGNFKTASKAFLVLHRFHFPKIHDLLALLDFAVDLDADLEALRVDLNFLYPYAIEFRYPGENATIDESREAVRVMLRVRRTLRAKLNLADV